MLLPPDRLNSILTRIPDAVLDIRYATANNFTRRQLYNHQLAWLRHEPLEALVVTAEELSGSGYHIVIFDAFRPPSVQKKLRAVCSDEDYVSAISNHCRGITVDLTLADSNGIYLDMGTDYDDFTDKSHPASKLITSEQRLNRQLLSDSMCKAGYIQHPREWWHFDFKPDEDWDLIYDETNTFAD